MDFANKNDFQSIEKFIRYFQETCKHLKYSNHPVVSAPSGLTLGGGFEVMVQSNFVASHTNIVSWIGGNNSWINTSWWGM